MADHPDAIRKRCAVSVDLCGHADDRVTGMGPGSSAVSRPPSAHQGGAAENRVARSSAGEAWRRSPQCFRHIAIGSHATDYENIGNRNERRDLRSYPFLRPVLL